MAKPNAASPNAASIFDDDKVLEVEGAVAEAPEFAVLPILGQAGVLLFWTGLVPVVGQGLVLSCVKLEAPVNKFCLHNTFHIHIFNLVTLKLFHVGRMKMNVEKIS